MTAPSAPTLEQRRARHAWEAVQTAKGGQDSQEFRMQAKRLPARVTTSGLGHALAFLDAKGYAPALLQEIGDWVLDKRDNAASTKPKPASSALIQAIVQRDAAFLRFATEETLAYLRWLTRFAEAEGLVDDGERSRE